MSTLSGSFGRALPLLRAGPLPSNGGRPFALPPCPGVPAEDGLPPPPPVRQLSRCVLMKLAGSIAEQLGHRTCPFGSLPSASAPAQLNFLQQTAHPGSARQRHRSPTTNPWNLPFTASYHACMADLVDRLGVQSLEPPRGGDRCTGGRLALRCACCSSTSSPESGSLTPADNSAAGFAAMKEQMTSKKDWNTSPSEALQYTL